MRGQRTHYRGRFAISDCVPVEELAPGAVERAFGDYAPGRFGWRLAGEVRLPVPAPARGLQGLWLIRPEVMNILEQALSTFPGHDLR